MRGFSGGAVVNNLPVNVGDVRDMAAIPGLGRSLEAGNGNPFQFSCLRNPMDREPGGIQSMGLQKNWTQLSK